MSETAILDAAREEGIMARVMGRGIKTCPYDVDVSMKTEELCRMIALHNRWIEGYFAEAIRALERMR